MIRTSVVALTAVVGFSLSAAHAQSAAAAAPAAGHHSKREIPHKTPLKHGPTDDKKLDARAPGPGGARSRKRRISASRVLTAAEKHRFRAWNNSLEGPATYYGVHERLNARTANGEKFDPTGMTAASRTLPLGSYARVTCKKTGRSVLVRVNDRGPYDPHLVMDLSLGAARAIGLVAIGTGDIKIEPIVTEAMR